MEAQEGGRKSFLISSHPAWDRFVRQKNRQPLFALGNFREVEELLSTLYLSCSRSRPASNDSCRFMLMKCGFLTVASVVAVQGGEITTSVDHIWMENRSAASKARIARSGSPERAMATPY